jgi:hypothetical protein
MSQLDNQWSPLPSLLYITVNDRAAWIGDPTMSFKTGKFTYIYPFSDVFFPNKLEIVVTLHTDQSTLPVVEVRGNEEMQLTQMSETLEYEEAYDVWAVKVGYNLHVIINGLNRASLFFTYREATDADRQRLYVST